MGDLFEFWEISNLGNGTRCRNGNNERLKGCYTWPSKRTVYSD